MRGGPRSHQPGFGSSRAFLRIRAGTNPQNKNMKNKTKNKNKTIFSLIEWLELLPFLDILFDVLIH